MKWRQIIAEKDTEKEIAQEWDKFIFEAGWSAKKPLNLDIYLGNYFRLHFHEFFHEFVTLQCSDPSL